MLEIEQFLMGICTKIQSEIISNVSSFSFQSKLIYLILNYGVTSW